MSLFLAMKNGLLTILILLFALPALMPWLSHGSLHALHDHQAQHHGESSHSHEHSNSVSAGQSTEHPSHFDATTYFADYLHVDLQKPEQAFLKAPVLDVYDFDYPVPVAAGLMPRYELASIQSRAPPDTQRTKPDKTPLYLSTQRLRI